MGRPKKATPGAFGRNNAGPAGLRNAAVDAADEPDAGARANEYPTCRTCTRTHTSHTSAHAHPHAHAHTHTHTDTHTHARTHAHCNPLQSTRAHEPARTRSHARTLKHTQCHSLARSHWAHAPAHPARWTACAGELLQLRQQLAAQGVELQQLRQSNAALVAAAEATARRNRDTSTRRKQRATKSATKAHDGMAEVQQEWEEGARWAPPTQAH